MAYTDRELKNATEVAYKDFEEEFSFLVGKGEKPPFSIDKLCEVKGQKEGKSAKAVFDELFKHSEETGDNGLEDFDREQIKNWQILDIYDNNSSDKLGSTGFYGCVIKADDDRLIVAFRGSEGFESEYNFNTDWKDADLKLLNSTLTKQQEDVERFIRHISKSDYIDSYKSIATAGHSLGGNLALHGAVAISEYENLYTKLKRAVSYDGPGCSTEYLKKNADKIEAVKDKMTHFKWSTVGSLLLPMPGVERESLRFKESSDFGYNFIGRHARDSIEFDENGNAVRDRSSGWYVVDDTFGMISQGLDHMPQIVGDTLLLGVEILSSIAYWCKDKMFEEKGLTPFGQAVVASAIIFIATNPVMALIVAGVIISYIIQFGAIVIGFELLYEYVPFVKEIVDFLDTVYRWGADRVKDLMSFISSAVNKFREWWKRTFNDGYKYAVSNPKIVVDTFLLNEYKDRLAAVVRRIYSIDQRIDELYAKEGLSDLRDIIRDNALVGNIWRLSKCETYLSDTASEFDSVEQKIIDAI